MNDMVTTEYYGIMDTEPFGISKYGKVIRLTPKEAQIIHSGLGKLLQSLGYGYLEDDSNIHTEFSGIKKYA